MRYIIDWLSSFLAKRNLETPNQLPIYTYKTSEEEYTSLTELLKCSNIESSRWDACFVIYACEWWRREFPGGHWKWEPIIKRIQKSNEINATKRSEIVRKGFAFWGREVLQTENASSYLGTIILESGIPNFFFQEEHYISKLISNLYGELGAISSMEEEYLEFINREINKTIIPKTLRNPQLHTLLGSITLALVRLQEKYNLSREKKPIDILDSRVSDWRSNFPISLDSDEAKKFIDRLLSDIVKKEPQVVFPALVEHYLENRQNGEWSCQSVLSIKRGIVSYKSFGFTPEDYANASNKLELFVATADFEGRVGFAFKAQEQEAFKVDEIKRKVSLNAFHSKDLSLFFFDGRTGNSYEIPYRGLDIADSEAPVNFIEKGGNWVAVGIGSFKNPASNIRMIVPEVAKVNGLTARKLGSLKPEKSLYEVSTKCLVSHEGSDYTITPLEKEEYFEYKLKPKDNTRFIDFLHKSNENLFIGTPKIFRLKGVNSLVSRVLKGVEYQGDLGWTPLKDNTLGNYRIRIREGIDVKYSKRISVLPEDMKFSFPRDSSSIEVETSSSVQYIVKSDISSHIIQNNGKTTIKFEPASVEGKRLPDSFGLEIICEEGDTPIKCIVPYPKQSCTIFNGAGEQLVKGSRVNLNQLFGCRLSLVNLDGRQRKERVRISLVAPRFPDLDVELNWAINVEAYAQKKLPLITLKPQIQKLFSLTSDIDAFVKLKVSDQSIEISQFPGGGLQFLEDSLTITSVENLSCSVINAFRFDVPFNKDIISILPYESQRSSWSLPAKKGIWLIYPGENSSETFRPKTFINPDNNTIKSISELHEASNLPNQERHEAIRKVFDLMYQNHNHPDWSRLINLFDSTKHLPLAVMDYWKVISLHRRALIAAFLKFPKELVFEISEEFSVSWLEYPLSEWQEAFNYFIQSIPEFDEEIKSMYIKQTLEKFDDLLEVSAHKLILNNQKLQSIPKVAIERIILDELNGLESQPGLKARHHQVRWPTHFDTVINEFIKLPKEIRHLLPRDIPRSQQQVVYLPFVLAATAVGLICPDIFKEENPLKRFKINELIDFDERWFREIYNLLVGHLWNQLPQNQEK